ncbi:MAG: hypothetical protein ABGX39_03655 [Methylococcales bacterium]
MQLVNAEESSDGTVANVDGTFKIYGVYSSPENAIGDDFQPSLITVGSLADDNPNSNTSYTAKYTTINLSGKKGKAGGNLQLQFNDDDKGTIASGTESYIYYAYVYYDHWEFGLNHGAFSYFVLNDNYPDIVNWYGPNGLSFELVYLARYSNFIGENIQYQIALENVPTATNTTAGTTNSNNSAVIPNLVWGSQYGFQRGNFYWGLTLRSLQASIITGDTTGTRQTAFGWAGNFGLSFNFNNKNRMMFQYLYGDGGSAYFNGTNLPDVASNSAGTDIETVQLWGATVAYTYNYTPSVSTTLMYSTVELVDKSNTVIGATTPTNQAPLSEQVWESSLNVQQQLTPELGWGLEYIYGQSEWVNGQGSNAYQVQMLVDYKY